MLEFLIIAAIVIAGFLILIKWSVECIKDAFRDQLGDDDEV